MIKTLLLDNYDSFTFNLYQYLGELGGNPVVYKNDEISLRQIEAIDPTHIVISPGPGTVENSKDFGICAEMIRKYTGRLPILGVCLGHQGIIKVFGGGIQQAPKIMHGRASRVVHTGTGIFKNVPSPFTAMRYHSLCGSPDNFPSVLKITARVQDENSNEATIMAVEHSQHPVFGIQFHQESFATPGGKQILKNFLTF